ncbi:DUF2975 domain-containing protein [Rhodococcus sp. BP-349]|uniref:DUF2975 domain-containing protein n=1 Tax=unclassified Rhodococcus (in: high G+C Gram-positive bacteria) TaxID=192944 RepID=UPI001C9B7DED|nr:MULTISPECIES: DUF2975 domain-containing protein [unclassified Rhodococcus (in: high G+C Gram-positive bacteria)]MBY6539629.1 DUF2975 domain-containing protein [Rhodococcus sp. BP-363]MBY6544043.1 DUF2975 domain-containing protein [Rhodococcus sp. BP-369]MBY6563273.1 DUF2975 domain-containing protein [Rhodococcus sp. BP-370]MBY6577565.1 DUF2975 domain-containing protein [Rhodococcus sp. BP-364]MBY6586866.1 DUF2975 domain-containing protein [Rhodococcus sp. BP-358]
MITERRVVATLRVFLVGLFALLVLFQVMSLPGQFAHMARENPDSAYLRWPLTALTIFWVVCVQIVVIATWKLLTLVRRDRIFSDAAFVWVDAIVRAIVAAGVSLGVVFLVVGFNADDPGPVLLLFLLCMIVGVAALLMTVMRALLRKATDLHTDLEGVI